MICTPCREPHRPEDCIDSQAGREPQWRHCACQHHPYETATATTADSGDVENREQS